MMPVSLTAKMMPRGATLDRIENWLMKAADAIAARSLAQPSRKNLKLARIVAHRGIYDNVRVFENTLPAFDAADEAGIWGIECDVRWTRDHIAVVHHDPDGRRLFDSQRPIEALTLLELQQTYPAIPTLATMVARYGRRRHLMIEVKAPACIAPEVVNRSLAADLAPLTPGDDFHLMSFSIPFLAAIEAFPHRACLPIARLNPGAASRAVADYGFGGLTGHYAVISRRRVAALLRQGRCVGTGLVNSRGCMFRELTRRVDWLFSDRPLALQRIVGRHSGGG